VEAYVGTIHMLVSFQKPSKVEKPATGEESRKGGRGPLLIAYVFYS
jgi:hypothetical protein